MDIIMWLCIFLVFIWIIQETEEVKDARLILPRVVRAGTSATLLCLYDLEKAPLYSVQWYRGRYEFFRYNPNENPPYKIFKLPGFNVDTFSSNGHQVTLRNIPTHISGEISCEITADAPSFSTSCTSSTLTVIELDLDFQISQKRHNLGDIITANCTSSPSDLRTKLIFYIDNKQVSEEFIKRQSHDFATLEINDTSADLNSSESDKLIDITCSAKFDDIYYVTGRTISIQLHDSTENIHTMLNKSVKNYIDFNIMLIFMSCVIKYGF